MKIFPLPTSGNKIICTWNASCWALYRSLIAVAESIPMKGFTVLWNCCIFKCLHLTLITIGDINIRIVTTASVQNLVDRTNILGKKETEHITMKRIKGENKMTKLYFSGFKNSSSVFKLLTMTRLADCARGRTLVCIHAHVVRGLVELTCNRNRTFKTVSA